jgi:hypothetical protein
MDQRGKRSSLVFLCASGVVREGVTKCVILDDNIDDMTWLRRGIRQPFPIILVVQIGGYRD